MADEVAGSFLDDCRILQGCVKVAHSVSTTYFPAFSPDSVDQGGNSGIS